LGLSFKETGRLSLKAFLGLYKQYKDNFDLEMLLYKTGTTYERAKMLAQENEEWF